MSFLREPGDLSRTPLAAILLEAWNLRATGELTVQPAGRRLAPLLPRRDAGGGPDLRRVPPARPDPARARPHRHRDAGALARRDGPDEAQAGRRARGDGRGLAGGRGPGPRGPAGGLRLPHRRDSPTGPSASTSTPPSRPGPCACWWRPCGRWSTRWPRRRARPSAQSALALARGARRAGPRLRRRRASPSPGPRPRRRLLRRLETASTADEILATPGLPVEQARAVLAALLLLGLAEPAGDVIDLSALGASGAQAPRPSRPAPPAGEPPVLAPVAPADASGVDPARRSDPEESRARRQRLLARAMQNMGVGPLSAGPPRPATPTGAPPDRDGGQAAAAAPGARAPGRMAGPEAEIRRALEAALPLARESDLFARLGLPRGASPEEVKAAYLQLVKQFHPDRFGAPAPRRPPGRAARGARRRSTRPTGSSPTGPAAPTTWPGRPPGGAPPPRPPPPPPAPTSRRPRWPVAPATTPGRASSSRPRCAATAARTSSSRSPSRRSSRASRPIGRRPAATSRRR